MGKIEGPYQGPTAFGPFNNRPGHPVTAQQEWRSATTFFFLLRSIGDANGG